MQIECVPAGECSPALGAYGAIRRQRPRGQRGGVDESHGQRREPRRVGPVNGRVRVGFVVEVLGEVLDELAKARCILRSLPFARA